MDKPKLRRLLKDIAETTKDTAFSEHAAVKKLLMEIDTWRPEKAIVHHVLAIYEATLTLPSQPRRKRRKPSSGNSDGTTPPTPK